jgi:hypothetical protein
LTELEGLEDRRRGDEAADNKKDARTLPAHVYCTLIGSNYSSRTELCRAKVSAESSARVEDGVGRQPGRAQSLEQFARG